MLTSFQVLLKDILTLCENRLVLFDNKTKDDDKRTAQVQKLLSLVNTVVRQNDGKPFTDDEIFIEMRKGAGRLQEQQELFGSLKGYSKEEILKFEENMQKSYDEQLMEITEMAEAKLRETATQRQQRLAEEQAARKRAEEQAHEAQMKSNDEIQSLRESLERARKVTLEAHMDDQMRSNDEIRSLRESREGTRKVTQEFCKQAKRWCAML